MRTKNGVLNQKHPVFNWRQALAALGILLLAVIGWLKMYRTWREGYPGLFLLGLGCFWGPAATYFFGYFWCLPDVLGKTTDFSQRPLLHRWRDFARLSTFCAILIIFGAYINIIRINLSYVDPVRALPCLLIPPLAFAVSVEASVKYLGLEFPVAEQATTTNVGWRARVRCMIGALAERLVALATVERSFWIGGTLILSSLFLDMTGNVLFSGDNGYRVIVGRQSWLTFHTEWPLVFGKCFLALHQAIYALGLLLAIVAPFATLPGRSARAVRESRFLCSLAAIVAMAEVTDVALTLWSSDSSDSTVVWSQVMWLVLSLIPSGLWVWTSGFTGENRNLSRLAICIFYLPIFMLCCAFLIFNAYTAPGFGCFVVGSLLVWWGFVQAICWKDQAHNIYITSVSF